jgi:hypothetical protein
MKTMRAAAMLAACAAFFIPGCVDEGPQDRQAIVGHGHLGTGLVVPEDQACVSSSGPGDGTCDVFCPRPEGLRLDWGNENDYQLVETVHMGKALEDMDSLGSMLKLRNTDIVGQQTAVLWQDADDPVDAAVHPMLELPYFIKEETILTETPDPGGDPEINPWQTRNDNDKDPSYGDPPSSGECISGTSYPVNQCAGRIPWQAFHFSWLNYCPYCGGIGTLAWEGVPTEGGIYCTICDVDADAVSGFGTTCVGGIGNAPAGSCTPACETRLTPCPAGPSEITTTPHLSYFLGDIEITYFKDGEDCSVSHVASIGFTGHTGENIVGLIIPHLVLGTAQMFSFDLKSALDAADPGSHYYVKKIAITHTLSADQLLNIESRRMGFGTLTMR